MPVEGYVTSSFGWRTHPIWGYRSLHDGVDFGAGCGTPIRAAADGVVLSGGNVDLERYAAVIASTD